MRRDRHHKEPDAVQRSQIEGKLPEWCFQGSGGIRRLSIIMQSADFKKRTMYRYFESANKKPYSLFLYAIETSSICLYDTRCQKRTIKSKIYTKIRTITQSFEQRILG